LQIRLESTRAEHPSNSANALPNLKTLDWPEATNLGQELLAYFITASMMEKSFLRLTPGEML